MLKLFLKVTNLLFSPWHWVDAAAVAPPAEGCVTVYSGDMSDDVPSTLLRDTSAGESSLCLPKVVCVCVCVGTFI